MTYTCMCTAGLYVIMLGEISSYTPYITLLIIYNPSRHVNLYTTNITMKTESITVCSDRTIHVNIGIAV